MRIRKTEDSAGVVGNVTNTQSDSTKDTYSCDYINDNKYSCEVLEAGYDIDTLNRSGIFGIFNASGTLPSGFSTSDNNIFIQSMIWGLGDWGRQILYDIRTNDIYSRNINNGVWQSWDKIATD